MHVSNGGSTISTTVNAGGNMTVSGGGFASATTVKTGGKINGFTISEDQYYASGLHVSNAYVTGSANLYEDQTATSTTVNGGGNMYVLNGGSALSTMLNAGGNMYVLSGGTASITFSPWSRGYVSSAYGANVTYLERDANVYWGNNNSGVIGKGNSAERVIISRGVSMLLYSNGVANATTVSSGGTMSAANGCSATATTVKAGGNINGFLVQQDNYYTVRSNRHLNGCKNWRKNVNFLRRACNRSDDFFRRQYGSLRHGDINDGELRREYECQFRGNCNINDGEPRQYGSLRHGDSNDVELRRKHVCQFRRNRDVNDGELRWYDVNFCRRTRE